MSSESYTVPTLSLANSRSRKNIPTKDAYQPRKYSFESKNIEITSNPYIQKKQQLRVNQIPQSRASLNFFNLPPKPRTNEMFPPTAPKREVKEISRNVYLSSEEQPPNVAYNYSQSEELGTASNVAIDRARQILGTSGSRGSLFRNPQSRLQIENEVRKQTNNMEFKKIDINKALFDRKLTTIMQQIQFYDEQLNGLYTESIVDQIQQLEDIKEQSKQVHSKLLRDLNALIA